MADNGEVDRTTVLIVLQANGIEITQQKDGPTGMMVLVKGEIMECRRIPARCGRRVLHYFDRVFKVPIHQFYHPETLRQDQPRTDAVQ